MRRNDHQGFHQVEWQIQDREQKEQIFSTPSLMVLPTHISPKHHAPACKVDPTKPTTLTRQIPIYTQPLDLMSQHLTSGPPPPPPPPSPPSTAHPCTLHDRYILSQQYTCVYYKYSRENAERLSGQELKRMFGKGASSFASYFISMDFLSDGTGVPEGRRNLLDGAWEKIGRGAGGAAHGIGFDSRFQCGNLYAVFRCKDQAVGFSTYDLIIQNDVNTRGYNNWFYFMVRNGRPQKIKLRIVNMTKPHSLFLKGMRPSVFSHKAHLNENRGWQRRGTVLSYSRSNLLRGNLLQITLLLLHSLV